MHTDNKEKFSVKNKYRVNYVNRRGMRSMVIYHAETETEAKELFLTNPKNKKCILISVAPA